MLASLSSPLPSGGFTFSISSSPFYSSLEAKQRTAAPPTLPSTIPSLSSASSTLRESRGLSQSLLVPKVTPLTTRLPDNVKVSTVPTQSASTPTTTSPLPTAQTTTTKTTSSLSFSAPAVISNVEKKAPIDAVLADFQASTELEKEKELIEEEKIPEEIQKFERCLQRELQLLEELKQYYLGTQGRGIDHSSVETQSAVKLGEELRAIMERKRLALSFLMPTLQESDNRSKEHFARVLDKLPQTCMDKVMSITSQPAEVAVANRYLLPVPEVAISPSFRGTENGTSLIVSVKLCYHGSEKEVSTTMQGKQEILQGIKQVNVDKNGRAAFGKLKVMEVSSKHRHQSFCLVFYLEEYSPQGSKRTLTHVKSTPFHVQSRPAKRKRDSNGESNGSAEEAEEPEEPSQKKKKKEAKKLFAEEQQQQLLQQQQPPITAGADRSSPVVGVQDCNYIDITDLLTLPQKEAARRLGISESMLCKRFKECTRRKWPYRYLRKIDKVINMLNLHKSDDGTVPKEDQEKLQRLNKEREECLRPVRIRITSYDRMSPMMRLRSRAADYDEEDIPIDALETLEMLKSGPSVNSPKSRECDDNDGGLKDEPMTEKSSSGDEGEMQVDDEEEEEEEGRDAVVACLANESNSNCCNSENNKDTNGLSASSSSLSISEEDEDMSESSSSSSDFELSEQAKEEGASSLFAFGRDCTGDREEEDKMVEASVPREPISPPSGPSAD